MLHAVPISKGKIFSGRKWTAIQHNDALGEKNQNNSITGFPLSSFHFPSVFHSPAVHIISYTLASPLSSPELNIFCNNRAWRDVFYASSESQRNSSIEAIENSRKEMSNLLCWSRAFAVYEWIFFFCGLSIPVCLINLQNVNISSAASLHPSCRRVFLTCILLPRHNDENINANMTIH